MRAGIGGDEGTAKKEKSHCGDWLRGTAFRAHGGLPLHRESGARGTSRDCASRNGSPSSRGLLRSLSYPCGRSTGKMVPFRGSRERICARTHARSRRPPSGGTLPVQWDLALVPCQDCRNYPARSSDWAREGDCQGQDRRTAFPTSRFFNTRRNYRIKTSDLSLELMNDPAPRRYGDSRTYIATHAWCWSVGEVLEAS